MRNWNIWQMHSHIRGNTCFYFTYEELKRRYWLAGHPHPARFLLYLWGIETHSVLPHQEALRPVFTLPMRNWNKGSFLRMELAIEFLLYLWGIETISAGREKCGKKSFYFTYEELKPAIALAVANALPAFLLYLWGIETILWQQMYSKRFSFLLYLWGIETRGSARSVARTVPVFTLPMRNWNGLEQ